MSSPLISVMMPAYNAENTIVKALKSLQQQTYPYWECIVVDDGSIDNTSNVVLSFNDDRIKLISLEKNMGRGYARQVALDNSNGTYIAMLDADDWYYSTKLKNQIEVFSMHPEVSIVSCGMAVTDVEGNIVGVRSLGDNSIKTLNKPATVPVPHAPTMYKKSLAINTKYDPNFKLAQDVDFLRRIMLNQKYVLLNSIGYVYEEQQSNLPKKVMQGYYYSARGYIKFINKYPLYSAFKSSFELVKILRLGVYTFLGKFGSLIKARSILPTEQQKQEFLRELNNLSELEK